MIHILRFFALVFFGFLFFGSRTVSAEEFIAPSEIHPGMVGIGKTVFQGTKIETFKVTAIGVLPKALPDSDLILVRVDSPYLKGKKIGLVSGMSGSPVYFNGKLAGAIAYGWPFTREALAGITPIEPMLRAEREGSRENAGIGAPSTVRISRLPESVRNLLPNASSLTLEALSLPVSVSGFDAAGRSRLQSAFPMWNVVPGGSGESAVPQGPLEPGQSVGAALMEGDFSVMATGTLTYRDGDKVLAFGHPFLFLGSVDLPLYEAYVHYVLPSIQLPFKFASPIAPVGTVLQDRLYAIGGRIGEKPEMVPLDINVSDEDRSLERSFHVRIFRNPDFTPRLTGMALEQAISSTSKLLGDATAHIDYEVDFKNHPPIHLHNLVLSEQSISSVIGGEILKPMVRVLENDFERVDLARIKVSIAIHPNLAAATLQKVVLSKHHLDPGEPLTVSVFLKPYNGPIVKKSFDVQIPSDIQGNVQVGVAGGTGADELRKQMDQSPPDPMNVDQIIRRIQSAVPDNSIVIRLTLPRRGIHWAGDNYGNMPQPIADLLKAAGSDPIETHPDGTAERYEMPWVVIGTDIEDITIGAAKEAPPTKHKPPRLPSHNPELPVVPPIIEEPSVIPTYPKLATPPSLDFPDSSLSDSEDHKPSEEKKGALQSIASLKDWQDGKLQGLAISPDGDLRLGPKVTPLAKFDETVILSSARSGERVFVGTGNPGKIYEIKPDGRKSLFFDPGSVAVTSLSPLRGGGILAGVIGGILYRLDGAGRIEHKWQLDEKYIWQIFMQGETAFIATGNPRGKIYKQNTALESTAPELYASSSESHILSVYGFPDGRLFAGTANNGLLLEIKNGNVETLYDFEESDVLSLGGTSSGDLIVGTSGKGNVYLLNPSGHLKQILEVPDEDITWVGSLEDKILAATGIPARLYAVRPGDSPALLWDGKTDERVNLHGNTGVPGDFYVSGNPASLFRFSSQLNDRGEFLSKAIDSGGKVEWGKMTWHGSTPTGTAMTVQSRSGNSPVPDRTWSEWSTPYPESEARIQNPAGRYIQFKVGITSEKPGTTPNLEAIQYFRRLDNLAPAVEITSPSPGDIIGPKSVLHAKIRDKDGDTVKVELFMEDIKDNEKSSQRIFTDLYPIPKNKGEDEIEIPLDMIKTDGHMHLRAVISDLPSNSRGLALSSETVTKDLTYDSTIPELEITNVTREKNVTAVTGTARDHASYIKAVQFKLDDGDWLDTVPESGMFDSSEARWSFELDHALDAEKVEIQALDGAGNKKTIKKTFEELTGVKPNPELLKKKAEKKEEEKDKSKSKSDSSESKDKETKDKSKVDSKKDTKPKEDKSPPADSKPK